MDAIDYVAAAIARVVSDPILRDGDRIIMTIGQMRSSIRNESLFIDDREGILDDENILQALARLEKTYKYRIVETPHAAARFIFGLESTQTFVGGELRENDILGIMLLQEELGWAWLFESAKNAKNGVTFAESLLQDQAWAPLPIDRPDPDLDDCVKQLEAVGELVREDNGYSASEPAERDEVLSRLEAGIRYLNQASLVTATAMQVYVVWPLTRLLSRFSAQTAVGTAAALAKEVFKAWLKERGIKMMDSWF